MRKSTDERLLSSISMSATDKAFHCSCLILRDGMLGAIREMG